MLRWRSLVLSGCLSFATLACAETHAVPSAGGGAGGTVASAGSSGSAPSAGASAEPDGGGSGGAPLGPGGSAGSTSTAGAATAGVGGALGGAAGSAAGASVSLLVFSRTAGYRHDSIPVGIQALSELATARGWQLEATEDASRFTDGGLAG